MCDFLVEHMFLLVTVSVVVAFGDVFEAVLDFASEIGEVGQSFLF